jgi:hypothetical protein
MDTSQIIRTNARKNFQIIISHLENYYLNRENGKAKSRPAKPLCLFCGADQAITKEHVLPRWAFEKHPGRKFKTTINGLSHKYNQTTLPACATCNNALLSRLEKEILQLFSNNNLQHDFFQDEDLIRILRWLEILDYKFQVFSLVTKFNAVAGHGNIPFLEDFSLSVLDPNIEYSPAKVMRNLRTALKRITVRAKQKNINSLVIFKSSNPEITFFHKNNNFIFLELPQHRIAVFYFYERTFIDVYEARDAAMECINNHYNK